MLSLASRLLSRHQQSCVLIPHPSLECGQLCVFLFSAGEIKMLSLWTPQIPKWGHGGEALIRQKQTTPEEQLHWGDHGGPLCGLIMDDTALCFSIISKMTSETQPGKCYMLYIKPGKNEISRSLGFLHWIIKSVIIKITNCLKKYSAIKCFSRCAVKRVYCRDVPCVWFHYKWPKPEAQTSLTRNRNLTCVSVWQAVRSTCLFPPTAAFI